MRKTRNEVAKELVKLRASALRSNYFLLVMEAVRSAILVAVCKLDHCPFCGPARVMIILWLILAPVFTDPQQSSPTPDEQVTAAFFGHVSSTQEQ